MPGACESWTRRAGQSFRSATQEVLRLLSGYTDGFALFIVGLAIAQSIGMPDQWIGWTFMATTVAL
jgi:hypothetical protein